MVGAYIFNVVNPFEINVVGGLIFKPNEKSDIPIEVINNLAYNNIMLKVKQRVTRTNQILQDKTLTLNAITGKNNYKIEMDTSNLGVNEITLQAFYPIEADGKALIPSDIIKISTEIKEDKEKTIIRFVDIITPQQQKENIFMKIWNKLKSFFRR